MRIHTLFWAALSELASPRRCSECSEKLGLALSSSEFLGALGSEQLGVAREACEVYSSSESSSSSE